MKCSLFEKNYDKERSFFEKWIEKIKLDNRMFSK